MKRTVQLLLIDGDGAGRIQAQLDNWTGVAYKIPKLLLSECKERSELKHCGVYFLFDEDELTGTPIAYVGQIRERKNGESLLARFSEHTKSGSKSFVNEVIFFTTSTNVFGPTELCYLENRFYELAKDAGRYRLTNGNAPSAGTVTEAKEAELNLYIENAKILMSALGHRLFIPMVPEKRTVVVEKPRSVPLSLDRKVNAYGHIHADGLWTTDGVVVLKGSQFYLQKRKGISRLLVKRKAEDLKSGLLKRVDESTAELTEDVLFASPSAAGIYVLNGSVNGRTAWKDADSTPLGELEEKDE